MSIDLRSKGPDGLNAFVSPGSVTENLVQRRIDSVRPLNIGGWSFATSQIPGVIRSVTYVRLGVQVGLDDVISNGRMSEELLVLPSLLLWPI